MARGSTRKLHGYVNLLSEVTQTPLVSRILIPFWRVAGSTVNPIIEQPEREGNALINVQRHRRITMKRPMTILKRIYTELTLRIYRQFIYQRNISYACINTSI